MTRTTAPTTTAAATHVIAKDFAALDARAVAALAVVRRRVDMLCAVAWGMVALKQARAANEIAAVIINTLETETNNATTIE